MDFHKNLANRVKKAKRTGAEVVSNVKVTVQGSSREYSVFVGRSRGTMSVSCQCKGNRRGTVCYHGIAAVLALAGQKNMSVSFCISEDHAQLVSRFGGRVYKVVSANGDGGLWIVVRKVKVERDWRTVHLAELRKAADNLDRELAENPWRIKTQQAVNGYRKSIAALEAAIG